MARILLVDDDETVGKVFRLGLANANIDVVMCTGVEALSTAMRTQPDIAVVDVMMPDVDGPEVVRQFRSNASTARIPVVFLSAKDASELKVIASQAGAVKYLTKPFSPRELFSVVKDYLRRVDPVVV